MHRPLSLLAALACLHAAPRVADACSAPACWPGAFLPAEGVQVPANLPGIVWQPTASNLGDPAEATNVVLATADAPTTPLPFTAMPLGTAGAYVLVPDAPLAPGTAYVVRDGNACGDTLGPTTSFTTAGDAPLPSSLGTIYTSYTRGPLEVGTSSGSCSTEVDAAIVDLELELDAGALPWRDALVYETFVDGQPWRATASINVRSAPGTSWVGRGKERLYRVCSAQDTSVGEGLTAGPHEVTIVATVPGSSVVVATQTATVDLSCGGLPPECIDEPALCGDNENGGCAAGRGGSAWAVLLLAGVLSVLRRHGASSRRSVSR